MKLNIVQFIACITSLNLDYEEIEHGSEYFRYVI